MRFFILLILISTTFISCKKECDHPQHPVTPKSTCDTSLTPIVMVHGFLASGDTWAKHKMRFIANGYCPANVYVFDWNSLNQNANTVQLLDDYINQILSETGKSQVNLVGHSAGGGIGYQYCSDQVRAAKIAHYVHVASSSQSGAAGGGTVPTLNLWSTSDEVGQAGDISGATNRMLPGQDHYEVATSEASFLEMYRFFNNNNEPSVVNLSEEESITFAGRVLTLGENQPISGASIEIYETDPATGFRLRSNPDAVITSDANGMFGGFSAKKSTPYEFFVVTNKPGDRNIHYYREGSISSNSLIYLRTLPPSGSTAGLLLSSLPKNDQQSVAVVFTSSQAVVSGRDNLLVNTRELSTPQISPASSTNIALFLYDSNNNGQTDMTQPVLFTFTPFLEAVDLYIPTINQQTISCQFNGRNLNMQNWKSDTEGIAIAVFD